jgi:hypothetical protein
VACGGAAISERPEQTKAVTGATSARVTTHGHDSYPRVIRSQLGVDVRHRKAAYTSDPPFDPAVVLFKSIVQVDIRPVANVAAEH